MMIVDYEGLDGTCLTFPGGEAKVHRVFGQERPRWNQVAPEQADLFVATYSIVPADASPRAAIGSLRAFAHSLPHFDRWPERHVLTDFSDFDRHDSALDPAIVMKVSANGREAGVIAIPYPVPSPDGIRDIALATTDVSFQGSTVASSLRKDLAVEASLWNGLTVEFRVTDRPFWMMPPEMRKRYAAEYIEQIDRSRFVACPRGRGLTSRRFFEVLSRGRIPVLIADAAKLPLESVIPYDTFVVRVPEGFARWTPDFIAEFRERVDLSEASRRARQAYDQWLAPRRFRELVEASLAEK